MLRRLPLRKGNEWGGLRRTRNGYFHGSASTSTTSERSGERSERVQEFLVGTYLRSPIVSKCFHRKAEQIRGGKMDSLYRELV